MKLFTQTCEKLLNESSSLNKIEIISNAIKEIKTNEELYLFSLYLTGKIYPSSTQKTINVGKALLRDAVINLTGISKEDWEKIYREYGETGDAVYKILSDDLEKGLIRNIYDSEILLAEKNYKYSPSDNFSLEELSKYIDKLSDTSRNLAKANIITQLLSQLMPIEAKFTCKLLLQNLRIGVQEATVEAAIAKAFEVDKKQVTHLNFYLGDIGEVAIRCKEKNFSDVEFKLFHPIKAMLASAEVDVDEIFRRMNGEVWVEYKYDGVRAHVHKKDNRIEIFTRDLKRITDQFPEIVDHFLRIRPDNFLIDGEIVPFLGGKIHPFAYIQKRLGRKEGISKEAKNNPATFIAYDFLYYDNKVLFDMPLKERRNLLEQVFSNQEIILSTKKIVYTTNEFLNFFRQSKKEGREGLMIKNPESKYESGKRGIHWLKFKQTLDPLDVVIMIAEYGEGKNAKYLSSYTFGVWDEKKENIVPIGRVASGATEEDLKYFTEYLPTIAKEKIPNGYVVLPEVILEVGFENIQRSERYSSGYAVRFPRILRNRTGDKPLDEISTIDDVKRIYQLIKGKTTK